jgi:hypothetical protein
LLITTDFFRKKNCQPVADQTLYQFAKGNMAGKVAIGKNGDIHLNPPKRLFF